jgi:HlyD family secretion protein
VFTAIQDRKVVMRRVLTVSLLLAGSACHQAAPPAPAYQALPVERRDIIVSARANGTIQPDTTVEVKSQASGEVLQVKVETGQVVKQGDLLVHIDPRIPRNNLEQAKASLEVAQAHLQNSQANLERSTDLYQSQSITKSEFESAQLDYATSKAGVVTAQVAVQNAQITLDQTDVRAPITGTIIELDVERGQVISSPTSNVGEGTVLLKMADMNRVEVSALVDETDVGKVQAGQPTSVTVDAYPNRPFEGRVLKIEPQATIQQNVTMFPVLIRIENREGLLRTGMNTEVEIHVGQRDSVLAVPNAALRTQKDVSSAAQVLGLSMSAVQQQLAAAPSGTGGPSPSGDTALHPTVKPAGNVMTMPDGREVSLPPGVTEDQVRALFRKRMSGQELSTEERGLLRRVFQGAGAGAASRGPPGGGGGGGGGGASAGGPDARVGGRYIVFVKRPEGPVAVNVRTGLTDLDYSEVLAGLTERDSVLILPSASLVNSQQEFKQRIGRLTGGGIPGMQQQPSGGAARQPAAAAAPAPAPTPAPAAAPTPAPTRRP